MEMSVIMILQNFHPYVGGAEKQALALSQRLAAKGVSVDVVTRRINKLPSTENLSGVKIHRLWTFGLGVFNSSLFMIQVFIYLLRHGRNSQIFHAHLASSHALAAALAGRIMGKKVIIKVGGGREINELTLSQKGILGKLKLTLFSWLKPLFVLVSLDQRTQLPIQYRLIPNGVDLNQYQPPTIEEKKKLRETLKWKDIVFLYAGRFSEEKFSPKKLTRLLEVWNSLSDKDLPWTLVMVGEGPLRSAYGAVISQKNARRTVHLNSAQSDMAQLYQAADYFLLPSSTEGLSNALLEALACGLPVVGSKVPGIQAVISEGKEGLLFNPESSQDMKAVFTKILNNTVDHGTLSRNAAQKAQNYSLDKTVKAYLDLYQEGK